MSDDNTANPHDKLPANFDDLAGTYDAMHFLRLTARRLVELANLKSGECVLDVATGTGVVALLAAQQIGSTGSVIGIDISPEMLTQAQAKKAEQNQQNVIFQLSDAMHLDFPDAYFDAVFCASSIYFMPDFAAAIKEWQRVLKPAGVIAFNTYEQPFLEPLNGLWNHRLQQHNLTGMKAPHLRLSDAVTCEQLLHNAGFSHIDVYVVQLGYYLPSYEVRWRNIESGLEGMPICRLPIDLREQIKAEYGDDVADLITDKGLWVNVPAIFALGQR